MKPQTIIHNQKRIDLCQEENIFTVTSDSITLVDFINIKKDDQKIIDFGSGIGTIPLLLSTKTNRQIIGFEIQEKLVELSNKTIKENQLENQIKIIHDKIQNSDKYFPPNSISLIVSNPPYFKLEEKSLKNPSPAKAIARHELEITFEELVESVNKLLKNEGRFLFIHRTERFFELVETLKKYNLEPKRVQFVHPKRMRNATVFLLEAVKNGRPGLKILPPIIRKD